MILENHYIQAFLILLFSLGLAKGIDLLFTKGLVRLAAHTKTTIDERLIGILHRPIFYSILFAGIYAAIARFTLPEQALFYLGGLLKTLALIIWSWATLRVTLLLIQTMERRARGKDLLRRRFAPLFENLSKIIVVAVALIVLLSIWGIPVTALLASAGLMGLVIGFAARDILANFFGGLFVLADSPYKIGDYIVLDSGDKGIVMDIGLRSTRIKTKDDIEITIPNAQIANSKIINESGPQEKTRVRVRVGVAYGSDVDKVKAVLTAVAEGNEHVCPEPAPRVRFREFGASGLVFELLAWIDKPVFRGRVMHELNRRVYKAFYASSIEIPYAKRDVYIKEMPGTKA